MRTNPFLLTRDLPSASICVTDNPDLRPSDILNKDTVRGNSSAFLFMSSIEHINTLKRGPFNEHSPVLYNIASTVTLWSKVNSGLVKMYQAEVLEKHQVVQHFWFGDLLPWRRRGTNESLPSSSPASESLATDAPPNFEHTKAPWVTTTASLSQHASPARPTGQTAAPWIHSQMNVRPTTDAQQGTMFAARRDLPLRDVHSSALQPTQTVLRQKPATTASTGSAAAMSSPLGAISQPCLNARRYVGGSDGPRVAK